MRINRKIQAGILFVLYLHRSGKATLPIVAANLKISPTFLSQVAKVLVSAGLIRGLRGANGGYEVIGEPTMGAVFKALGAQSFLSPAEGQGYELGDADHRAFAHYVKTLTRALQSLMKRTVANIGKEVVANEMAALNRALPQTTVN